MPTTLTSTVDRTYAQALLALAQENHQVDEVAEQVAQLDELLGANPSLRRLLSSPLISAADRAGTIRRLFEGRVSDVLYRFLQVLGRKGRLGNWPGIARALGELVQERHGIVEVDAYVAAPLDDTARRRVADGIGAALGKTVQLQQHVDDLLIGGLKIRVGDQLIDATVATQLRLIREKLIAAGRSKAKNPTV